jgi:sugar phosphate isomerase/epimerase
VRSASTASGYQFVELGEGSVNVRDVFAALADVSFRGLGRG